MASKTFNTATIARLLSHNDEHGMGRVFMYAFLNEVVRQKRPFSFDCESAQVNPNLMIVDNQGRSIAVAHKRNRLSLTLNDQRTEVPSHIEYKGEAYRRVLLDWLAACIRYTSLQPELRNELTGYAQSIQRRGWLTTSVGHRVKTNAGCNSANGPTDTFGTIFAALSRFRTTNTSKIIIMKNAFFSLVLLCGLALFSTSCNKDNGSSNVTPEVQSGEMTVGNNTSNIVTAKAVNYGQKNAIVLANKEMTADNNEGIAIIFNGDIVTGTYTMGNNSKDPVPTVVGFHEFNLGELPFIMGADTLFYGDTYYWMNGELAVVQNNDGTYHVVLSQCMGTNNNGHAVQLALNFTGPLGPYTFDPDNKFKIKNTESLIGLAGLTQLSGLSSLGLDVKSMIFMSANRKRFYIVSYLGGQLVDGEYNLGYIGTPYLPNFPCVHVALDGDFWTFQPQTGYIAKEGTLKVVTNDDGTKTVTMEDLKLKNVEHDSEFLWPLLDGWLQYHGYMYELSL